MIHRPTLIVLTALVVTPSLRGAEIVQDPIPAKIGPSAVAVKLEPVATGLVAPIALVAPSDGSGRLFVVEQTGQVRVVKDGKLQPAPLMDVSGRLVKLKPGFDERGLIGFALHPDFAAKGAPGFGRLYTWTSEPVDDSLPHFDLKLPEGTAMDNQMVLAEWRMNDAGDAVDPATRRELMRIDDAAFNHNGAPLAFDDKKLLYIPIGDGGGAHDSGPGHSPQGNGQDTNNPFSTILRIDPLTPAGDKPYTIPADNPLVGKDGMDEIYAWGLRNVWGLSFDAPTGRLIAADVGQAKIEEINVIEKGGNYGWSIKEGAFYYIRSGDQIGQITSEKPAGELPKFIDPVAAYDHDEGISITGGYVYRGKAIPSLVGKYVFGDWAASFKGAPSGRLFVADLDTGKIEELLVGGNKPGVYVRAFGVDAGGEVYLLSSKKLGPDGDTGAVHRLSPVP
jgi:glucose/arabinose dehydrogenase